MKTAFDSIETVFPYLDVIDLKSIISGSVFRNNARGNSKDEDVCINALSVDDSQRQQGLVNVNIYVPDVKEKRGNEFVPVANDAKLGVISKKVVELLGGKPGHYFKGGNFWVSNISGPMAEPEIKQHKINVRVEIRFNN